MQNKNRNTNRKRKEWLWKDIEYSLCAWFYYCVVLSTDMKSLLSPWIVVQLHETIMGILLSNHTAVALVHNNLNVDLVLQYHLKRPHFYTLQQMICFYSNSSLEWNPLINAIRVCLNLVTTIIHYLSNYANAQPTFKLRIKELPSIKFNFI